MHCYTPDKIPVEDVVDGQPDAISSVILPDSEIQFEYTVAVLPLVRVGDSVVDDLAAIGTIDLCRSVIVSRQRVFVARGDVPGPFRRVLKGKAIQ